MGVEIERKYLVNMKQWNALKKPVPTPLRQGYMLKDDDKTIRIRTAGKKGFITIKGRTKGFSRSEHEYEIPLAEAEELLNNFCGSVISKNRYEVPFAGKLWEVDEFLAENKGLYIAEIELDDEAENFESPPWIGEEVTSIRKYFNSNLSTRPYSSW